MKEAPKYQAIRDALLKSIQQGLYGPGQRLPAEKEIAIQFGVSHMTARHAVTELVESGILERRVGSGAYVRSHEANPSTDFTVHVLCPAVQHSLARNILRVAEQEITVRGWKFRPVQVQSGIERHATRVLEQGGYALVIVGEALLNAELKLALVQAKGRAVLVGNRATDPGVPFVLADDRMAIRSAIQYLQEQGHSRIGVLSSHPDEFNDSLQISTWRESLKATIVEHAQWLLSARPCNGKSEVEVAYEVLREHLQQENPVTALICFHDELALAANAACHDCGFPVPEKMSIIVSGDSPLMELMRPSITCIDVNLRQHVQTALDVIQKRVKGPLKSDDFAHIIEPNLVIRQSVAPL